VASLAVQIAALGINVTTELLISLAQILIQILHISINALNIAIKVVVQFVAIGVALPQAIIDFVIFVVTIIISDLQYVVIIIVNAINLAGTATAALLQILTDILVLVLATFQSLVNALLAAAHIHNLSPTACSALQTLLQSLITQFTSFKAYLVVIQSSVTITEVEVLLSNTIANLTSIIGSLNINVTLTSSVGGGVSTTR